MSSEYADRFRSIIVPHMDAAYALARSLSRDPVIAEDVVQDAFLNAFRGFAGWRGGSSKAWFLAIVRNCFFAAIRRVGMTESLDVEEIDPPHDVTPEAILIQAHDAARLRAAIDGLPTLFRETLVLRELEELSYREIAIIVDVPIGTVMSRLSRARGMLAQSLCHDTMVVSEGAR